MNISKLVTFYNSRKDDRRDKFENHLSADKGEDQKILDSPKNSRFPRLEILTIYPYTHKVVSPKY